jgi:hypothetical protein
MHLNNIDMRKIIAVKPLDNYILEVEFENNCIKLFDFSLYLSYPVFKILKDINNFNKVVNKGYFIEWETFELDLSADTLWHEGKEVHLLL